MLFGFIQMHILDFDKETFLVLTKRLFHNPMREHIRRAESNLYFSISIRPGAL